MSNIQSLKTYSLLNGATTSCGCSHEEKIYNKKTKVRVRKSYVGQKFNMLTVIEELGKNKVLCKCDCGNEKILAKSTVINGGTKSCGCLRKSKNVRNNIVGKKFGKLTVLKELGGSRVYCQCDCGNGKIVFKPTLLKGEVKSCGCLRKKL